MLRRLVNGYRFCDKAGDGDGSGGAGGDDGTGAGGTGNTDKTVQYPTYKRTVDQLKTTQTANTALQKEVDEYKEKERAAEEERLTKDGETQKLLDLEREKRKESDAKNITNEKLMLDAHKLNAFREKLPGKMKNSRYYDFVDTEKIIVDPATGILDEGSLDSVVNAFVKDHSSLIETGSGKKLPDNASGDTDTTELTHAIWLKLPLAERNKRYQEMRRNDRLET